MKDPFKGCLIVVTHKQVPLRKRPFNQKIHGKEAESGGVKEFHFVYNVFICF